MARDEGFDMDAYNCNGSIDNSYGAGAYNTCTTTVGSPNTGVQAVTPYITFFLPLTFLIVIIIIAIVVMHMRKKRKAATTDESL